MTSPQAAPNLHLNRVSGLGPTTVFFTGGQGDAGKALAGVAVLAAITALLAAFAGGARGEDGGRQRGRRPYKVGIVYSRTGLLAAYGAEYIQGLRYGLAYATKGTMKVNGRPIELTVVDDGTDPTKAVAAGRDLIGKGYKILAGSVSSGVALQMAPLAAQNKVLFISGPAATDAITGINKYTFRSGRQTYQDVKTAATFLQRRRQEGDGLRAGLRLRRRQLRRRQPGHRLAGPQGRPPARAALGAGLHAVRAAGEAGEPRPALRRLGRARPRPRCGARSSSRASSASRTRSRPASPSARPGRPSATSRRRSTSSRTTSTTAPKNKVNDFLVNSMRKRGQVPDLFTPDGFVAGQMIVHALDERERRQRRQDDLGARGLELRRPEGPADDPRSPTTR